MDFPACTCCYNTAHSKESEETLPPAEHKSLPTLLRQTASYEKGVSKDALPNAEKEALPTKEAHALDSIVEQIKQPSSQTMQCSIGGCWCLLSWSSCFSFLKKQGSGRDVVSSAKEPSGMTPCSNAQTIIISGESSKVYAQDTDPSQPLSTLVELGKYAAAYQRLEQTSESDGLDECTLERVRRVGAKFNEAMRMFQSKPADLSVNERNTDLGLHWGLKLEGNVMQIVSVKDYDVDIVKMIALDLHRDWEDKTSADDITQEIIGKPFPHDICWRRRAVLKGVGQKVDDVMIVNSVNALDNSLHAICSIKYTVDESASHDPHGTPVPAVDSGFSRTPFAMFATAFTPLSINGDKMRGVRKIECLETKLSPMIARVLGWMPSSILKGLVRGNQETMAKLTVDLLESPESDKLLSASPHEGFLKQAREQILACDVFV